MNVSVREKSRVQFPTQSSLGGHPYEHRNLKPRTKTPNEYFSRKNSIWNRPSTQSDQGISEMRNTMKVLSEEVMQEENLEWK